MLFAAILIALFATVAIEYIVYKKFALRDLRYEIKFSTNEAFEGDDIYLFEEITNDKKLPVPYLKIDSDLPDGLKYCLFDEKSRIRKLHLTSHLQSVFVLRPGVTITRRWRVRCVTRGDYSVNGAIAVSSDLLGLYTGTERLEFDPKKSNSITVLPRPYDLEEHFTSSRYLCGDVVSNYCPVSDPLRLCGAREYIIGDPMNTINWKSTAAHGKLMVNIRENTVRHQFNIVLNMNSRDIEKYPTTPSDPLAVEKSINLTASILDRVAVEDIPVRIITNNPCADNPYFTPVDDGEIGKSIMVSDAFHGRHDIMEALRMLSSLKLQISVPTEKMLDHICQNPELYCESENLIVVSAYLDKRLLNLHAVMKKVGVNVIYYITSTRREAILPDGVDVYFRAY